MKKYSHAWLSLKAVELLKSFQGQFSSDRNKTLKRFLSFISKYPNTFVRGAWFPDTVIKDNTQGGHTWKYYLDPINGKQEKRRPPSHNHCLGFVKDQLTQKISLDIRISDLPDRCEALSQMIRDSVLITNKTKSGDVVAFNDSQIALFFLMLSHYVCDAHVPVHCDNRDFYTPSKIHPDLEGYWEKEVKKYYVVSTKMEQFDLSAEGSLQLRYGKTEHKQSMLGECDRLLGASKWDNMQRARNHWSDFLGKGNKNIWDYLVSVCSVSFQMSLLMFPIDPPSGVDYSTVRIMKESPFNNTVVKYSPFILADAINSVALLWLASWERWELLAKGIK